MEMIWTDAAHENGAKPYKEHYKRSYGSTGINETRYEALRVKIITTHSNVLTLVCPGCQDIKQTIMDGVEQ